MIWVELEDFPGKDCLRSALWASWGQSTPYLWCFSRHLVLTPTHWGLFQNSVSERSPAVGAGRKKQNVSCLQISFSGNWLTQLFNTFPEGVVISLWGTEAGIHRTDKIVLSASWGGKTWHDNSNPKLIFSSEADRLVALLSVLANYPFFISRFSKGLGLSPLQGAIPCPLLSWHLRSALAFQHRSCFLPNPNTGSLTQSASEHCFLTVFWKVAYQLFKYFVCRMRKSEFF